MREIVIGLDPGVTTGIAYWHRTVRRLTEVKSCGIVEAMTLVRLSAEMQTLHSVVFEDARKRKWFGLKGGSALQGAGSIKRDCAIWEEFCAGMVGVPFLMISPKAKGPKLSAEQFQKLTGWAGRTNEHARDAAMCCWNR